MPPMVRFASPMRRPSHSSAKTDAEETTILHAFAQEMGRLDRPLIVTWGGRHRILPLLRYRAIARGVTFHFLRTPIGPGGYFMRYASDWHLDLEDVLCSYGAIPPPDPLYFHALIGNGSGRCAPHKKAGLLHQAGAIYEIFLCYLRLHGLMTADAFARAQDDFANAPSAAAVFGRGSISPSVAMRPTRPPAP